MAIWYWVIRGTSTSSPNRSLVLVSWHSGLKPAPPPPPEASLLQHYPPCYVSFFLPSPSLYLWCEHTSAEMNNSSEGINKVVVASAAEEEQQCRIIYIPDKPPVPPHLQPTGKILPQCNRCKDNFGLNSSFCFCKVLTSFSS